MRYATCDIDETLVPDWMISGARAGSNQAKQALRVYVSGATLVKGVRQMDEDLTVVSLRELCQLGAVKSVTIGESK